MALDGGDKVKEGMLKEASSQVDPTVMRSCGSMSVIASEDGPHEDWRLIENLPSSYSVAIGR